MFRRVCLSFGLSLMLCVPWAVAGCSTLSGLLDPTSVTIQLVNNGSFEVTAIVYTSDDENVFKAILTTLGTRREFAISAGQSTTLVVDCDDLRAIIIDKAELQSIGTPSDETNVLRDGDDFDCGNTIVFTFDHSLNVFDFNIKVSVGN